MSIYLSAGHHLKDPGACANGLQENNLTMELRDLILAVLANYQQYKVVRDLDKETLGEYLHRIQPGDGSVVLEVHFDSSPNEGATGCTVIVGGDADRLDKRFGDNLAKVTSDVLGISNRGVMDETQSHRGRLGLMREVGTVALLEVCFISNKKDIAAYQQSKHELAEAIAHVLMQFDDLVP